MAPSLAYPTSAVRVATLRLLCCFYQLLLSAAAATEADRDQAFQRVSHSPSSCRWSIR